MWGIWAGLSPLRWEPPIFIAHVAPCCKVAAVVGVLYPVGKESPKRQHGAVGGKTAVSRRFLRACVQIWYFSRKSDSFETLFWAK